MDLAPRLPAIDKQRALRHFARLAPRYHQTVERGPMRLLRNRERAAVLELADLFPGGTLIDVGCGQGFYARAAKRVGMRVTAVDAVPEMVERIRSHVDHAWVADLEQVEPFRGHDRVICAGVLDFVEDPASAFHRLTRLVAPGGKLVILAPRRGVGGLAYRMEKWTSGLATHLFDQRWFEAQAGREGLQLLAARAPLPHNLVLAFRAQPAVAVSVSGFCPP